ncbi:cyclopropane-fatty-acyl-phospholipid synthase [hydrocarbon metagenome]|uniref:Cyclopropane-fatty-acyl-phospholipid synthase n=1 Tax=hydrocarbon metagenome TaxID=938273 RepID=A0A0W8G9N5_9ZZZZ
MSRAERIVTSLLSKAGITVNGPHSFDIRVHNPELYSRILRDRSLGLGEAYMEGWWDCACLDGLFRRLCAAELDAWAQKSLPLAFDLFLERLFNRQSRDKSKAVARRHYDLGNDMFLSWLDPDNQYSCAYFTGTDDLETAQRQKLDLIRRKLGIRPGETVLDIGCGWGGLAAYLAEHCGCTVTGVNISHEQAAHAARCARQRGLAVEIVERDYRDLTGQFDKVVSVGMFEHVGQKNHRTFMRAVSRRLRDGGTFLLHTIASNVSAVGCDPFIRKYIFPGGSLPSLAQIARAAEGFFVVEDAHNLAPHYDKTLMAWNERFQAAWPGLRQRFPEGFRRMWEYYLLSCAGAFRARALQLWQLVMTKPGTPQPPCRVA